VAPLTEAVSGMSVNTLLRELAETPGFGIFIPGLARYLGGTEKEKNIRTYQLIIYFEKQCLIQVGFCGRQFILQSTDYLKISKAE